MPLYAPICPRSGIQDNVCPCMRLYAGRALRHCTRRCRCDITRGFMRCTSNSSSQLVDGVSRLRSRRRSSLSFVSRPPTPRLPPSSTPPLPLCSFAPHAGSACPGGPAPSPDSHFQPFVHFLPARSLPQDPMGGGRERERERLGFPSSTST